MFFHGISGSSIADTVAIARVTLPDLKRQGYSVLFGTAVIAAAGATALLVPPTVDLIIMGVVANISIAGLFAGGLIAAVVHGVGLIAMVIYISWREGYGIVAKRTELLHLLTLCTKAAPAALMAVIILGGILFGVFTPTEASGVAVVYGIFITTIVYRELTFTIFWKVLRETVELTGVVLLVIMMGSLISYGLAINQIPQALATSLVSVAHNRAVFLLLVQGLFFVVGIVTEGVPAIIILMPILMPVAVAQGIEPIHFGILVEANIALGLVIPPLGACLFAACSVARLPLEHVVRPILPLLAILVVTLFMITYVEQFSMFLPRVLGLTE
jgi:C4-dicarboxylate transporter DctM subunit